jgi:hypothetical protein
MIDSCLISELKSEIRSLIYFGKLDMAAKKYLADKYSCTMNNINAQVAQSKCVINGYSIFPTKKQREHVKLRDDNKCQYCYIDDGKMIIEHVVPTSMGGVAATFNLVVACHSCNCVKRSNVWKPINYMALAKENRMWANVIKRLAVKDCTIYKMRYLDFLSSAYDKYIDEDLDKYIELMAKLPSIGIYDSFKKSA